MLRQLLLAMWVLLYPEAVATWCGGQFLGKRHASSWHGETPIGYPETVNRSVAGVAAPSDIPFGTLLRLTRVGACNEEPSEYDGRQVIVVVLDRKERHEVPGFGPSFGDRDAGCVKVRVEVLEVCRGEDVDLEQGRRADFRLQVSGGEGPAPVRPLGGGEPAEHGGVATPVRKGPVCDQEQEDQPDDQGDRGAPHLLGLFAHARR